MERDVVVGEYEAVAVGVDQGQCFPEVGPRVVEGKKVGEVPPSTSPRLIRLDGAGGLRKGRGEVEGGVR